MTAVKGISIEVNQGEAVSIVGPNGAGKSTTLNTIAGLLRPSAGQILLEGRSIGGMTPEEIVRLGVGLVPEGRRIFGTLSVAENLQLGTTIRARRAELNSDLDSVLERFPVLKDYYKVQAGRLSGGEQQQLAIARTLLGRPRLMLLDEPSLGLAPMMVSRVFDILDEVRADGVTVLLVEQAAKRAVEFATRSYFLRSGGIAFSGKREDLIGSVDFAEAYLGPATE